MFFISFFYRLFDVSAESGISCKPFFALLGQGGSAALYASSLFLDQRDIETLLSFLQVAPRLSVAYMKRLAGRS